MKVSVPLGLIIGLCQDMSQFGLFSVLAVMRIQKRHLEVFVFTQDYSQTSRPSYCAGAVKSEEAVQNPDNSKGPVLRSALHGRRGLSKPGAEEGDGQPQAKKKKIDLIFKDVLEASLEASPLNSTFPPPPGLCLRSSHNTFPPPPDLRLRSAHSTTLPLLEQDFKEPLVPLELGEVRVDLGALKREEGEEGGDASTSFCPNCVKLKRRIRELEAELQQLRGEERAEPSAPPEPQCGDEMTGKQPADT